MPLVSTCFAWDWDDCHINGCSAKRLSCVMYLLLLIEEDFHFMSCGYTLLEISK